VANTGTRYFLAKHEGRIIAARSSTSRDYTYAVVSKREGADRWTTDTWHSTKDLAAREFAKRSEAPVCDVVLVKAEQVDAKAYRQALAYLKV
jgi:hypothetical protein